MTTKNNTADEIKAVAEPTAEKLNRGVDKSSTTQLPGTDEKHLDPRVNEITAGATSRRVRTDDRLDVIYMSEMRCPYCKTKIPRGTAKCKNCGLTKEQIYYAKLAKPFKRGQNILMSKIRPADLPFWKMGVGSVFGFLGIHCFIAKRYLRGVIMLLLTALFIAEMIIFPPAIGENAANAVRTMFEEKTHLFPGDLIGIVALGWWVVDFFAVFFRQFHYPVVIQLDEVA